MEKLKILIIILVVAGGIYYAWNIVPAYFHNYEFQDGLDDIVRKATYVNINEEDLRQAVINKGRAMDIALKEEQIAVTKGNLGWSIIHLWTMAAVESFDPSSTTRTSASQPCWPMQDRTFSSASSMRLPSLYAGITMLYLGYCTNDVHSFPGRCRSGRGRLSS